MPNKVKISISILVLLVAAAGFFFQAHLGQVGPKYAVLFLGVFAVVAMWIFPEVQRHKAADTARR